MRVYLIAGFLIFLLIDVCICGCQGFEYLWPVTGKPGFARKRVVREANKVKVEVKQDRGVWLWFGETAVPSSSCSFFIINDEDSSSTTTTPTNISPGRTSRGIITDFDKGQLLGRGSFGSVYEGIADDGFFIAIKEVSLLDQGDMGRQIIWCLEQEIALLSQFEHENIVRFLGTAKVVNAKDRGYGLAADIWSLGCTVLEMLTSRVPYFPLEWMQALFRIGRGEPPPVPDSLSIDARDFILQCIRVEPEDRPTAAQLLDHPFVKRPVATLLGSVSPCRHLSG